MTSRLHVLHAGASDYVATAQLSVKTQGEGFIEITHDVAQFTDEIQADNGAVFIYMRHTSASVIIQENADPDVRTDLIGALRRIAPDDAGWIHDVEGPDDMPAHVKTMLTGISLHIPVIDGSLALGTWQGIYVAEHRTRPHQRDLVLQFLGTRKMVS